MRKRFIGGSLLGLAILVGWPQVAGAFSLGDIRVASRLGERFSARIPLTLAPRESFADGDVTLGGAADYQRIHLSRSSVVGSLRVRVQNSDEGGAAILLESDAPVQEPFFNVLVKASQGGGALVRNYPVLLSVSRPPADDPGVPRATQVAREAEEGRVGVAPPRQRSPLPSVLRERGGVPRETSYGPVARGQTLSEIAKIVGEGSGLTPSQVMVGLWQANHDKFHRDNMFGLIDGVVLRLPTADDMSHTSPSDAWRILQAHKSRWGVAARAPGDGEVPVPAKRARVVAAGKGEGSKGRAVAGDGGEKGKAAAVVPPPASQSRDASAPVVAVAPPDSHPPANANRDATSTAQNASDKGPAPAQGTPAAPVERAGSDRVREQLARANQKLQESEKQRRVLETQLTILKNQSQSLAQRFQEQASSVEDLAHWVRDAGLGGVAIAMVAYLGWRARQRRQARLEAKSTLDTAAPSDAKGGGVGWRARQRRQARLEAKSTLDTVAPDARGGDVDKDQSSGAGKGRQEPVLETSVPTAPELPTAAGSVGNMTVASAIVEGVTSPGAETSAARASVVPTSTPMPILASAPTPAPSATPKPAFALAPAPTPKSTSVPISAAPGLPPPAGLSRLGGWGGDAAALDPVAARLTPQGRQALQALHRMGGERDAPLAGGDAEFRRKMSEATLPGDNSGGGSEVHAGMGVGQPSAAMEEPLPEIPLSDVSSSDIADGGPVLVVGEGVEREESREETLPTLAFSASEAQQATGEGQSGAEEPDRPALETIPFSLEAGVPTETGARGASDLGDAAQDALAKQGDSVEDEPHDDDDLDLGALADEAGVGRYHFEENAGSEGNKGPVLIGASLGEAKTKGFFLVPATPGKPTALPASAADGDDDGDALDLRAISADLGLRGDRGSDDEEEGQKGFPSLRITPDSKVASVPKLAGGAPVAGRPGSARPV